MKVWVHILSSSILAALLYPLFNWKVLLILAGGVLIDIDHYLWYVCKFKNISVVKCYGHFMKGTNKGNVFKNIGVLIIFHTIEFLLVMLVLSFYIKFALLFTIGLLSHYLLDLIWLYFIPKCFIANPSIINFIIKKLSPSKAG